MEQIVKHFTPAMAAFAVGVLLVAILAVVCASDGVVAQQMNSFISAFFTSMSAKMPA